MTKRKFGWSWRTKLVLLLVFFSAAPLGVLAYWSWNVLGTTFRASSLERLEALASAKAEALDQFTESRIRDVERIADMLAPDVAALRSANEEARLSEGLDPPQPDELSELPDAQAIERGAAPLPEDPPPVEEAPPAAEEEIVLPLAVEAARSTVKSALGLILWDQKAFEELLVMDANGVVLASTFGDHENKSAAELDYFKSGRRATHVQPVFVSPITNELTMVIATPIRDRQHQEVGVLAARLNLTRFFRLINDTTGLGESGETLVAKRIGDEVVFMAPTRHDDAAALTRKLPGEGSRSRALREAARGREGSGEEIDYRDVRTLAAWREVPSLAWGLMVKMDHAEAMRPAVAGRQKTAVLAVAIILLAIVASLFVGRAFVRPLRHLKLATDRISRGDFDVQLHIDSQDEVGELADSFERMIAAIKFFREHSRPEDEEDDGEDADTSR